jgi:hypothetical protein
MADNRTEIAVETIDRIAAMLIADSEHDHGKALNLLRTFKSVIELTAPPKVGRPRKPAAKAE